MSTSGQSPSVAATLQVPSTPITANDLPDLPLLSIFGNLPYVDMFRGAMPVSRRWNALAREQLATRRHLNLLIYGDKPRTRMSESSYFDAEDEDRWNSPGYSTHLLISLPLNEEAKSFLKGVVRSMARLVPKVRHFRLRIEPKSPEPELLDLMKTLHSMLMFYSSHIETVHFFLDQSISFGEHDDLHKSFSRFVYHIMSCLPSLRHLRIWDKVDIFIVTRIPPQLESVQIRSNDVTDSVIKLLLKNVLNTSLPLRSIRLDNQICHVSELKLVNDQLRDKLESICISLMDPRFYGNLNLAILNEYINNYPLNNLSHMELFFYHSSRSSDIPSLCQLSQTLQHLPRLESLSLWLNLTTYVQEYHNRTDHHSSAVYLRSVRRFRLNLVVYKSDQFDVTVDLQCLRAPLGEMFANLSHFRLHFDWRDNDEARVAATEMQASFEGRFLEQMQTVLPTTGCHSILDV